MQPDAPSPNLNLHTELGRLYAEIERLKRGRLTASTQRGYSHDWRTFKTFCSTIGRDAFPASAETLSLWIASMLDRGRKLTTVCRYVAGVAHYHAERGADNPLTPAVRCALSGARQVLCEQPRQVAPLGIGQLRAIAALLKSDGTAVGTRNLSIITLGFASALRRSNLSWMRLEDIEFCAGGLRIHIRREKNDPNREGRFLGVPYGKRRATCPVRCLESWLRIRGRLAGPVYTRLDPGRHTPLDPLTPNAILELVKQAAGRIDPDRKWGSHSLRAGLISEAGLKNISPLIIARQSGHRSIESLTRYFRPASVFTSNVVTLLGL